MRLRTVLSLVFAVLLLMPSMAQAIGAEIAIGAWRQSPMGLIQYNASGINDTLDLHDNLGLQRETRMYGRAKVDMPLLIPNVYLMYTPMEFEGMGKKNVTFKFGTINFNAAAKLQSKTRMSQVDGALYYGVPGLKTLTRDMLEIELGANLKVMNFYSEIRDVNSLSATFNALSYKEIRIPIPMLYGAAALNPTEDFSFEFEARMTKYRENHFYDYIGRMKFNGPGPTFAAFGYRAQDIKIQEESIDAELTFRGVFLEAGVDF